ncbi:hypothetical protein LINPERHAP1_LOCUS6936 [Linum perenne]
MRSFIRSWLAYDPPNKLRNSTPFPEDGHESSAPTPCSFLSLISNPSVFKLITPGNPTWISMTVFSNWPPSFLLERWIFHLVIILLLHMRSLGASSRRMGSNLFVLMSSS